jgi:hypothetical protein
VRLVTSAGAPSFDADGTISGRVELYRADYGTWHTFADLNVAYPSDRCPLSEGCAFTEASATVACRQLGNELGFALISAKKVDPADTDDGTGSDSFTAMCGGGEVTLDSCSHLNVASGASSDDVGVACTFGTEAFSAWAESASIRLQTNAGTSFTDSDGQVQGRLEVKTTEHGWVTIKGEASSEASVVAVACRQLGDALGLTVASSSPVSAADTDDGDGTVIYDVECWGGDETTLDTCGTFQQRWTSNAAQEAFGVSCTFDLPGLPGGDGCEECPAGERAKRARKKGQAKRLIPRTLSLARSRFRRCSFRATALPPPLLPALPPPHPYPSPHLSHRQVQLHRKRCRVLKLPGRQREPQCWRHKR